MSAEPTTTPGGETPLWRRTLGSIAPFLGILFVGGLFAILAPENLSARAWRIMLVQTVPVGLAAAGMTYVIISGGIDLSVGSIVALASVTSALTLHAGHGLAVSLLAAVARLFKVLQYTTS